MKRYRNLAVIAVVTTISLGTFFTKVAMSESKLPKFYLKTESGDEKYVKDLTMSAGYGQLDGRSLSITTDGSVYKDSNSMFSELDSDYFNLKKLNDLKKKERNFMRGKISSSQFYIDKDYAWYADVKGGKIGGTYEHKNNHFKMYIDGLDLQNKDRFKFKLDIPEEENYSYISVEDVQLIGKELVVTTYQNKTMDNTNSDVNIDQTELVMYRINVNQKKIVDRKVINKSSNDQKTHTHTDIQNLIQESDETVPSKYNVFKKTKLKDTVQTNGETTTEELRNEVVIFNLENNKDETLNLSNEQKEQVMQSNVILENDNLYFITNGDKDLSVLKYNLNNKKVEGEPVLISKVNSNNLSNYKIINRKLYVITNNIENPGKVNKDFIIADLANGQSVFEGKIEVKNIKGNASKALKKLQVYDFKVE
ncbi:hypothetical protein AN960_08925 [Bacillus sp. FJAT-25509]|uniref:hypothetical protein n=1 Tax=Bacillus sp. FJAT-25509 TaxID=1712029 RepID=UPI0006F1E384|nr:hypothetical protein [Bacillus sp. FJAT-25509]KQL40070.1 hypothetical protein AN960_08925 [Bacillus sp. FJAT-25509]